MNSTFTFLERTNPLNYNNKIIVAVIFIIITIFVVNTLFVNIDTNITTNNNNSKMFSSIGFSQFLCKAVM